MATPNEQPMPSDSPGAPEVAAPAAEPASAAAAAAAAIASVTRTESSSSISTTAASSSSSTSTSSPKSSASVAPGATVPAAAARRRKKPAPRPSKGGLAIGFTAEELRAQAAKRAAWMKEEVTERIALRNAVEAESAKSSNAALRLVLLVWAVVIVAIGWHVWTTIQHGLANGIGDRGYEMAASTRIIRAFQKERDQMPDLR